MAASPLAEQASPYLRAHAKDAVQWRPFGTAAFAEAKAKDKAILLSSGYLSCYWCHRMSEDSFRKNAVGQLINQQFIPILLDRELEPEVDDYLQKFMTQQRGFGGWPLTVMLTPDAKPIAGFSYQAADEFINTINSFSENWQRQRQNIEASAATKSKQLISPSTSKANATTLDKQSLLNNFLEQSQRIADNDYGGFGQTEKFPFAPQLATLLYLDRLKQTPQVELRNFLMITLQAMMGGGLRDHVGGGFFRYSDNRQWSAPHFEQMLYTQALMAPLLLQAGEQWKNGAFTEAGSEVLLGMINHFQRPDGLFRTALSAVSEKGQAGGYYLWTESNLKKLLGRDYSNIYALDTGTPKQYLPLIQVSGLQRMSIRQRLLNERQKRQMKYDDKALLGWNGLALSALARGSQLHPSIYDAGARLYQQLEPLLAMETLPRLIDTKQAGPAQFTDQVYFAHGLYEWGAASKNQSLISQAGRLLLTLYENYYQNGYWQAASDKPLIGEQLSQALVDTELPSASGLWLKTSSQLLNESAHNDSSEKQTIALQQALKTISKQLPDTLVDDAFFHGTSLSALLYIATQNHAAKESDH